MRPTITAFDWVPDGDGLLNGYPNLVAYVTRGEARPAFVRVLADQIAGFTGSRPPEYAAWAASQGAML